MFAAAQPSKSQISRLFFTDSINSHGRQVSVSENKLVKMYEMTTECNTEIMHICRG
jgi:hypothetical protein